MEVITNVQFDEVISKGVVVIDFFANWCGPCKMLAPVLEEVAQELPTVTFAKVDVDQDPSLPRAYVEEQLEAGKDVILEKLNPLL